MDGRTDGQQWVNGGADGRTEGRAVRAMDQRTDGQQWVSGGTDRRTDGRPPEWKDADTAMADGRTDRRTDLAVQQRLLLLQLLWGLGAKQRLQDRTLGETPPQFLLQGGIADWGGAIN